MLLVVDVKTVNTSLCLGVCDGVVFVASSVSLSPKTICLVYSPLSSLWITRHALGLQQAAYACQCGLLLIAGLFLEAVVSVRH